MFQRRLHRHVLSCASLLTLVASLHAADIHVPGDAPTIQDAVARAQDGDVILVGPGVWAGPVLVAGKAVRLVAVQGPMVTTIDGGSSPSAVVLSGTAGAATLEGFAVTGGTACRIALPAGKATVSRCRVARGAGRGIEVTGPGTTLIEDCLVRDNAGGGVLASGPLIPGSVLVSRCDIERNGSAAVAQGGGLRGDTIRAVDSLLAGNVARRGGGAAFVGAIEGCTFRGNEATVEGGAYYAIQFDEFSGAYLVKDTAFLGNTAPRAGGVLYPDPGFTLSPSHLFVGCTFAGNQDDGGGIGLEAHITAVAAGSALSIDHCTFVDDALTASDKVFVTNSILRGAGTPFVDCKGLTVSFSDVQGGWPGTGNIDADPLFVDAAHQVFALLPGSPCVNAGSGSADPDGSKPDLGALSLAPFCEGGDPHFGLAGLPALAGTGTLQPGAPMSIVLTHARPSTGAALVLGASGAFAPFKGGLFVPAPDVVIAGLPSDAAGTLTLGATWPAGAPSGLVAWAQFWIPDGAASDGFAASNGLGLIAP